MTLNDYYNSTQKELTSVWFKDLYQSVRVKKPYKIKNLLYAIVKAYQDQGFNLCTLSNTSGSTNLNFTTTEENNIRATSVEANSFLNEYNGILSIFNTIFCLGETTTSFLLAFLSLS